MLYVLHNLHISKNRGKFPEPSSNSIANDIFKGSHYNVIICFSIALFGQRLTRMRRIAWTISLRLFGRGTSRHPMSCKPEKVIIICKQN